MAMLFPRNGTMESLHIRSARCFPIHVDSLHSSYEESIGMNTNEIS